MEDLLGAHLAPVFVEGGPLDDLRLERIVRLGYQLPRECLQDGSRIDAVREEVV
jgi:hypothetical protein